MRGPSGPGTWSLGPNDDSLPNWFENREGRVWRCLFMLPRQLSGESSGLPPFCGCDAAPSY